MNVIDFFIVFYSYLFFLLLLEDEYLVLDTEDKHKLIDEEKVLHNPPDNHHDILLEDEIFNKGNYFLKAEYEVGNLFLLFFC